MKKIYLFLFFSLSMFANDLNVQKFVDDAFTLKSYDYRDDFLNPVFINQISNLFNKIDNKFGFKEAFVVGDFNLNSKKIDDIRKIFLNFKDKRILFVFDSTKNILYVFYSKSALEDAKDFSKDEISAVFDRGIVFKKFDTFMIFEVIKRINFTLLDNKKAKKESLSQILNMQKIFDELKNKIPNKPLNLKPLIITFVLLFIFVIVFSNKNTKKFKKRD